MVRRIFFNATILLGLNQLVTGSTNLNSGSAPLSHGSVLLSATVPGPGYEIVDVPSASNDLPQPPAASTDKFNYATVLIERNPAALKTYNANTPRYDMKKIPSGLKRFYEEIKGELAWFNNDAQNDALLALFEHIVNDRVEQFYGFEPEFQRVFGTGYGNFALAGRSVLGWLVAFGAAEILRSLPLNQYTVEYSNLDVSIKYLVEKNLFSHVAYVATCAPFLIKAPLPNGQTFLNYVMNKSTGTKIENLSVFFAELPLVSLGTISALIPILPNGSSPNALYELLAKVEEISVHIITLNTINKAPFLRDKAVKNLKFALQLFLDRCLSDFSQIKQCDRFTVAMLFIEAANAHAFERLLIAFPDMLHSFAKGKSLLQICIDESSILCAGVVARLNPELITQVNFGLHSPLLQSIMCDSQDYFGLFLPLLTSNDPIAFLGSSTGMRPTAIAMIHGKVGFLRQMVHHFAGNDIPLDIYADFEIVMDYLENEFIKVRGYTLRLTNLIPHSLWLYLIDEFNLEKGYPVRLNNPLRRSLLDFAVIDRNTEAVRLLIQKFGAQIVNQRCVEGPCQGNCLRFYKNDFEMLKLLVCNGVDINTPIFVTICNEGIEETKTVSILTHLLMFYEDSEEYVKSLNFSREALESSIGYSRKIFNGRAAGVAIDLLWERYQIRA